MYKPKTQNTEDHQAAINQEEATNTSQAYDIDNISADPSANKVIESRHEINKSGIEIKASKPKGPEVPPKPSHYTSMYNIKMGINSLGLCDEPSLLLPKDKSFRTYYNTFSLKPAHKMPAAGKAFLANRKAFTLPRKLEIPQVTIVHPIVADQLSPQDNKSQLMLDEIIVTEKQILANAEILVEKNNTTTSEDQRILDQYKQIVEDKKLSITNLENTQKSLTLPISDTQHPEGIARKNYTFATQVKHSKLEASCIFAKHSTDNTLTDDGISLFPTQTALSSRVNESSTHSLQIQYPRAFTCESIDYTTLDRNTKKAPIKFLMGSSYLDGSSPSRDVSSDSDSDSSYSSDEFLRCYAKQDLKAKTEAKLPTASSNPSNITQTTNSSVLLGDQQNEDVEMDDEMRDVLNRSKSVPVVNKNTIVQRYMRDMYNNYRRANKNSFETHIH